MSILEGLRESFRLPDLRRRILITLLLLIVYRLAANVPVPGVDKQVLEEALKSIGAFADVLDLLSGGAVSNFSVLANGVYPYITACRHNLRPGGAPPGLPQPRLPVLAGGLQ